MTSSVRTCLLIAGAGLALSLQAQPVINPGGVVSAGLSVPSQTILSPGAIFSIFGSGFAAAGTFAQLSASEIVNGVLPTTMAHACVTVGGVQAALFLVTPTQINAQVPAISTSGTTVQVVTGCDSTSPTTSNGAFVVLGPASPEFFYFQTLATGDNPVAAVDFTANNAYIGPGGSALPFPTAPASPGDIVVVYATGLGVTSTPTPPGTVAPASAQLTSPYTVFLGGEPLPSANILYAGVTPSYAGLYQLNIRVPLSTQPGPQNLTISVAGVTSPAGAILYVAGGGCTLPQIESFTAVPRQLTSSGSTQISWYVIGADTVAAQPSLGSGASTGQVTQNLSSSTTFQLTATNSCGFVSASVTVGVSSPAVSAIQDSTGKPVSAALVGDRLHLMLSNLGDASMIQDIVFTAPSGLAYAYPPDAVDDLGNIYFSAPILPEMGSTTPTAIQISALTVSGQQIASNQTLNVSLPTYSGNAVRDFQAYLTAIMAGYQGALSGLSSVSSQAAGMAPTLVSGVMDFLTPLQAAAAKLSTASSAPLQILPATSADPTPGVVTITAQDIGLFMALLSRTSVAAGPGPRANFHRAGASSAMARAMNARAPVGHAAAACPGIQEQVPLIPGCQLIQAVNQYVKNFGEILGMLGNLAGVAGAVAEVFPAASHLAFDATAANAGIIAVAFADADAMASVFCYWQPIWLADMSLSPSVIPDTAGDSNPMSSKVDVEAILASQFGPAITNFADGVTATASFGFLKLGLNALIPINNIASREAEVASSEYFADRIIAAFNKWLEEAVPNFTVPVKQHYSVGYCAGDLLKPVGFPANLTKPDLTQSSYGMNDFFLFGIADGTNATFITGNQNNFLFANDFNCTLVKGGATFICAPSLTVGPYADVILSTAGTGANNCTGTNTFADSASAGVTGQALGYTSLQLSSQSLPNSASLDAFQSLPNEWQFDLTANSSSVSNSAACYDSAFADAAVSALAQLSLDITYTGNVTVTISAKDCGTYSVTPMVGLTSNTSDQSQNQKLNGSGDVTWNLTGTGNMTLSANAGYATRVSNQQPAQVCTITGDIEFTGGKAKASVRR